VKKSLAILIAFTLVILTLGGCGTPAGTTSSKQQPPQQSTNGQLSQPINIKIATQDVGSAWYNYGAAFSDALSKNLPKGSSVDVLPYTGGIGNVKLVGTGEAQLGLTFAPMGKWGYEGKVAYKEKYGDLRALVGGLDQYYLATVARADVPMNSWKDIKTKKIALRINTQPNGSTAAYAQDLLFEAAGISRNDILDNGGSITATSTDVITGNIKDGRADLLIQPVVAGHPAVTDISISTKIKFIPYEDDVVDYLVKNYGFSAATLPAGSFKGQDQAVKMAGFPTILIANKELSDEAAYAITKILCENADVFNKTVGGLKNFNPEKGALNVGGLPLHPGAEKYYKEKGWLK